MKFLRKLLNRYYLKKVNLSFEANFCQRKKRKLRERLLSCLPPAYRPNEVITVIIGAIGTFLSTTYGVAIGGVVYGLTGYAIAYAAVMGLAVWASISQASKQKASRGFSGGTASNGHLVNSRLNSEPVKLVIGVMKVGGNWIFANPTGPNNVNLQAVLSWCEGEILGIGKGIDTAILFTPYDENNPGSNDMSTGGLYTEGPGVYRRIRIMIDSTNDITGWGYDTFRWSKDGGINYDATYVPITGILQIFFAGVGVRFGAITGHKMGDVFDFFIGDGFWADDRLHAYYKDYPGGAILADYTYTGTASQLVATSLSSVYPAWQDANRDTAYTHFSMIYNEEGWRRIPDFTALIYGKKLYDTRTGLTAFSRNFALLWYEVMTSTRCGMGIPASRIITESVNEAADWYDDNNYFFDGVIKDQENFLDLIERLMIHFRAFMYRENGKFGLKVYTDDTPVMSLTEEDIEIDPSSFEIVLPGLPETPSRIVGMFIDKTKDYTSNWVPYDDVSLLPISGDAREAEIDLTGTTDFVQAKKQAKYLFMRGVFGKEFNVLGHLRCFALQPGDPIYLTHEFPGWTNKKLRVKKIGMPKRGTIPMILMDEDSSIYDDSVDTAGGGTYKPPVWNYTLACPANPTEATGEDKTTKERDDAYLELTWDDMGDGIDYNVRYRETGTLGNFWSHVRVPDQGAATVTTRINNLPVGTEYEWQVQSVNVGARLKSLYTASRYKTTWSQTEGPDMTNVVLAAYSEGRSVIIKWSITPENYTIEKWKIYRGTTNDSAEAVFLDEEPGASRTYRDSKATVGTTYYYWLKAENRQGILSSDFSQYVSIAHEQTEGPMTLPPSESDHIPNQEGGFGVVGDILVLDNCDVKTGWSSTSLVDGSIVIDEDIDCRQGKKSVKVSIWRYPKIRYYEGGTNIINLGYLSDGMKYLVQGFKVSSSKTNIKAVAIKIKKFGSPTDAVTVAIYSSSGGNPATEIGSATISAASIPAGYFNNPPKDYIYAVFSSNLSLIADTLYHVVVSVPNTSATNFYKVAGYTGSTNQFGDSDEILKKGPALGSLTAYSTMDMNFRIGVEGDAYEKFVYKTINAADISAKDYIKFWLKNMRTGEVLGFCFGESTVDENTFACETYTADQWEWHIIPLDSVPAADRNAVTKIGFEIHDYLYEDFEFRFDYIVANQGEPALKIRLNNTLETVGILGYITADRGDPSAVDWDASDLTKDGAWHDLDCSGIVPAGAKFIHFHVVLEAPSANRILILRQNGNSNSYNVESLRTQVANQEIDNTLCVACDANRVVEYWVSNTTWTTIGLTIVKWDF